MTSSRTTIADKWAAITGSMSTEKKGWLDEYSHNQKSWPNQYHQDFTPDNTNNFPSIMPLAMQVAARTVGMDIVSVSPMGSPIGVKSEEEQIRIKNEVLAINRDKKIDSLVDDVPYEEMKVEDHPDLKLPSGKLFYMDYVYGATGSNPKKKKGKR